MTRIAFYSTAFGALAFAVSANAATVHVQIVTPTVKPKVTVHTSLGTLNKAEKAPGLLSGS